MEGREKYHTERVRPFPFFPFPPFLTAASPCLHGNCSPPAFFFLLLLFVSRISVGKLGCLTRRMLLSFLFCDVDTVLFHITIIISVVFFLSLYFFLLLTGVYPYQCSYYCYYYYNSVIPLSEFRFVFLFLFVCRVPYKFYPALALLFLFLWGICMKWSVHLEEKSSIKEGYMWRTKKTL